MNTTREKLPRRRRAPRVAWFVLGLTISSASAHAGPSYPGTAAGFEIDGNLTAGIGGIDWFQAAGGVGTGVIYRGDDSDPTRQCTVVDALRTHFERDPSWAQNDRDISVFGKGSDKNNSCIVIGAAPWSFKSGSGPQKNDITEAYATVVTDTDPQSSTFGHVFFIAAVGHRETNGDNHVDFELNQRGLVDIFDSGSTTNGITIGGPGTETTCGRSLLDQIISVDWAMGGTNPTVTRRVWQETSPGVFAYVETAIGPNFAAINHGSVEAPCEATQPLSSFQLGPAYQTDQFIEVAVDLTASGVPDAVLCQSASTLSIKTRSSDSFTSELKDRVTFPFLIVRPPACSITGPDVACAGDTFELCGPAGANLTYAWSGSGIPAGQESTSCITPSGLAAGAYDYHLVVTRDGCSSACDFTITLTELTLELSTSSVSCFGGSDGSITATFTGGTPPYACSLDGSPFELCEGGGVTRGARPEGPGAARGYPNLIGGEHTVSIRDGNGCVVTQTTNVFEPPALVIELLTATNVTCYGLTDGSITATFTGGTPPYQCSFEGGAFAACSSPTAYPGLGAGTYTVAVRDVNGCETNRVATIGGPEALTLELSTSSVSCFEGSDGSITATFTGGTPPYSCSLDGSPFELCEGGGVTRGARPEGPGAARGYPNLIGGEHTVSIRDGNGCVVTQTTNVFGPPALVVTLDPSNPTCGGNGDGSITLTVSGGAPPYQRSVDGGAFEAFTSPVVIGGLTAGTHTIGIRDALGCEQTKSADLASALCAQLAPTQTTCQDFINGMAEDLVEVCYGIKRGLVNNAAPGVLFYYSRVTAPGPNFTVDVVQTNDRPGFPLLGVHQGQAYLYDDACSRILTGTEWALGQARITVTGAVAGRAYVVGVKYSTSSVTGASGLGAPLVRYAFSTQVDGTEVDADPQGLRMRNCVGSISNPVLEPGTISSGLELYRPTPNPFTGEMRLAYAVDGSATPVDIAVYDLSGRLVRTLVRGIVEPGRYETAWKGRGDDGVRRASGIYFVRVQVGAERHMLRVARFE